jgi:hypothetical protein
MTQISAPHNSALAIGRVFLGGDSDHANAYALAQKVRLEPLNS